MQGIGFGEQVRRVLVGPQASGEFGIASGDDRAAARTENVEGFGVCAFRYVVEHQQNGPGGEEFGEFGTALGDVFKVFRIGEASIPLPDRI